jgi:hypothetical protein
VHVGQVEVEADDVVIVELAEVQALFAKVGRVDVEAFGGEHQLDALGGRRLVFDQQHTHRKLASRDGRSLIEFRPLTGRTHQIRVHAREGLGAGIVGDRVYGVPGGPMLLHASRLVVPRGGGKQPIDVTAPLPEHWGEWALWFSRPRCRRKSLG